MSPEKTPVQLETEYCVNAVRTHRPETPQQMVEMLIQERAEAVKKLMVYILQLEERLQNASLEVVLRDGVINDLKTKFEALCQEHALVEKPNVSGISKINEARSSLLLAVQAAKESRTLGTKPTYSTEAVDALLEAIPIGGRLEYYAEYVRSTSQPAELVQSDKAIVHARFEHAQGDSSDNWSALGEAVEILEILRAREKTK